MKKIILTIAATLAAAALILGNNLILSACSDSFAAGWRAGHASAEDKRDPNHIYPACAVVVALDRENDLVTVQDAVSFQWQFSGVEDWYIGDIAALLMYDNGTPSIRDDEIVDAKFSGTVDWIEILSENIDLDY